MDSRELEYVIAIAETKSFSQAAVRLRVSQPALSQYIRRMEKRLGCRLFQRDTQRVELTAAGVLFMKRARGILEDIHALEQDMKKFSEDTEKELSIGASQFYGKYVLVPLLDVLRTLVPDYRIRLVEGSSELLEEQLLSHRLDLGVFPEPVRHPDIRLHSIYEESLYFVIPSANEEALRIARTAWDGKKLDLYAFRALPFVMLRRGLKFHDLATAICNDYGFQPQAVYESDSLDTVYSLVSHNYGVAFLPSTLLPTLQKSQRVHYFPLSTPLARRSIGLACLRSRFREERLESIARALRQRFHQLLGGS
jgi:DNA-binding transcriptional LysR family regulator